MSTREGGVSAAPWQSLNLGAAVGDNALAVAQNRARFSSALGAQPCWLRQVHGIEVRKLGAALPDSPGEPADASWTDEPGIACTVLVADCLPVLFAARQGGAVAAAHAGWRGLAAGVLEATLLALQQGAGVTPAEVVAWLGPCIGPRQFEVGADVLRAFTEPADASSFVPRQRADGSDRWLADLQQLALQRLLRAGVGSVRVLPLCTVEDGLRFFSFRRAGVTGPTGRMAAAVFLR